MSEITAANASDTIGKYCLVDVIPVIVDLERSRGNRLVDAQTGRAWLDCISYIASNPLGHNHPKLLDPKFESRLLRAARNKVSNSDFFTVEMASFIDTFGKLAKPEPFKHLFFIEGGTLAVENALKAAFDWKVRKNLARGVKTELGTRVIHFQQAFHGRSGYALSLTNSADPRKTKYFPKFDWPRIINPKLRFPITPEVEAETIAVERTAIEQIEQAFARYPDDIAAILIEPIQGEGGDNHFRPEFHKALRELADKHEAMLIYDEVQSGIGLTGKMWAYEHYGIVPDMVAFGKKTQVCGFMSTARVEEVPNHVFAEASRLNSTWGGNICDMVRAEKFLQVIVEEKLVANAEKVGAHLQAKLRELELEFPNQMMNARGKGLFCAIDAPSGEARDKLFKECFDRGVLLLKSGYTGLRLRPSLTFTIAEADELVGVLRDSVLAVM